MIQRSFSCAKDVTLVNSSGTFGGVGAGLAIAVGQRSAGIQTRSELECQGDWTGAKSVTRALLRLKVANICSPPGGAVKFWVEKVTAAFPEGSFSDTCGIGAANAEKWPGSASTTVNRALYVGTPSVGDVLSIDITALAEASRAAGESKLRYRLIASDGAAGYDESTNARYCEFWSREKGNDGGGYKPRIELVLDDHSAPEVPADVSPATTNYQQQGEAATRVNTTFTITGRFVATESSSTHITASQVQFYPKTATDDGAGNVSGGSAYGTITGTGVKSDYSSGALDVSQSVSVPPALVGVEIRGRVRLRDDNGEWSNWTRLGAMRVIPNNRPTAPTKLSIDDTSAPQPNYSGRHNDPDAGSTVKAVETQVVKESGAGVEVIENHTSFQPGDPSVGTYTTLTGDGAQTVPGGGTLWTVAHDGRPLVTGERIKRRHRTVDQFDAVGAWSAWVTQVVGASALPTVIPDPTTKNDDLTPLIGASYQENISGLLIEAYAQNDLASKLLWQTPEIAASSVTSKTKEWGTSGTAVALQWGQPVWARVRVRVASTGNLTDWTDLSFVWINALPDAPALSIDGAVMGDDGILRVGSLTPRLLLPYTDPDLPNDSASKQVASISTPGNVLLWSVTNTTTIEDHVDSAAALAWETAYLAKAKYADSSGEFGSVAEVPFTTHRPPSLAAGTDPDETDPTPVLPWAATFYGGATQKGYQVTIDDVTTESQRVLDTGFVADTAAVSYTVPAYVLEDDHEYQATITVTDTLGIAAALNAQVVVAFSATAAMEMVATAKLQVSDALPADTFTRSLTDSWGTSSSGSAWEVLAHPEDFDVNGTEGTMNLPSANVSRKARIVGPNVAAITAVAKVKSDKLAVGGILTAALAVHSVDLSNYFRAELVFNADQTIDLKIARITGGSRSALITFRTALTHAAGTYFWIKANAAPGLVQAKAWQDGSGEPGSYQIGGGGSSFLTPNSGSVGLDGQSGAGITNAPVLLTFDALSSTSP